MIACRARNAASPPRSPQLRAHRRRAARSRAFLPGAVAQGGQLESGAVLASSPGDPRSVLAAAASGPGGGGADVGYAAPGRGAIESRGPAGGRRIFAGSTGADPELGARLYV